ncbi:MAG TPA: RpoN/RPB10 RNA polymerase subunit family protein [Candidatus Saccharimonadales bacterium]|nr:RpoN/RPB10 RNA polymerase subunit family protein [Candidatus Saccharimonadales bacterium]
MEKVINPKSGIKINVGGKLYNQLIKEGYTRVGDRLVLQEQEQQFNLIPSFYKRDINLNTYALPPIRCVECNKPLANIYKSYEKLKSEGITPFDIFIQLDIKRECCRMHLQQPEQIPTTFYQNVQTNVPRIPVGISDNPYLKQQSGDVITLIEGKNPPVLRRKIVSPYGVSYEPINNNNNTYMKKRDIAGGKYYVNYK